MSNQDTKTPQDNYISSSEEPLFDPSDYDNPDKYADMFPDEEESPARIRRRELREKKHMMKRHFRWFLRDFSRILKILLIIAVIIVLLFGGACLFSPALRDTVGLTAFWEKHFSPARESTASVGKGAADSSDAADTGLETEAASEAETETETDEMRWARQSIENWITISGDGGISDISCTEEGTRLIEYMQSHSEIWTQDLIDLAYKNPETLEFIYHYSDYIAAGGAESLFDTTAASADMENFLPTASFTEAETSSETVPLLYQWDSRWGYKFYGSTRIADAGCGPTCLSMLSLALTDEDSYTPDYVAALAKTSGYYEDGAGTVWTIMDDLPQTLGFYSKRFNFDEASVTAYVQAGHPVILVLSSGLFTTSGHFIILTDYVDGAFTINDPNSTVRSGRSWTYAQLADQIQCAWAFSAEDDLN